jgi:hypothetical protein
MTLMTKSDGGFWPAKAENPCSEVPLIPNVKMAPQDMADLFSHFFEAGGTTKKVPLPAPVVYDNMGESIKINERYPLFACGSLLDEVLEEFGGVQEIMSCKWDSIFNEGTVVCLMNDWRVFRYKLKLHEFSSLKHDERKSKINRECHVFEDIDEFGHWEELGGINEENNKESLEKKKKEEEATVYGEKMSDALEDFFSGNLDSIQKMMEKNPGK